MKGEKVRTGDSVGQDLAELELTEDQSYSVALWHHPDIDGGEPYVDLTVWKGNECGWVSLSPQQARTLAASLIEGAEAIEAGWSGAELEGEKP